MSRRLVLLVWLLCTCATAQEAGAEKKDAKPDPKAKTEKPVWLALRGGTVYPVSGPVIQGGTVLVKDGKIAKVGRRVKVPEGATLIDASGKHVVPGFVAIAARGALGSRGHTTREKAGDRFDPFSDTMLMCLSSGITTAHEGPGGRGGFAAMFGGRGAAFSGSAKGTYGGVVGKLTFGTIEGFELRDPAAVYMTWSVRSSTEREDTRAAFGKARKHLEKRRAWVAKLIEQSKGSKSSKGTKASKEPKASKASKESTKDGKDGKDAKEKKDEKLEEPKADAATAALARCLDGELPLFIHAAGKREILDCLELSDRFDVPMVIHGAMEAWTVVPDIGRRPVSMVVCHRGQPGRGIRPYRQKYRSGEHGWSIENAAHLSKAGVPWATATLGTGVITSLFAGRDLLGLPLEAAFAVRGGASNEEALRSITLTPAEILKVDDRVGSLEAGKDADLLVMDREPLDYRSFVEKAWVNGRLVYDKDKVSLWSHIRTDRSQPPGEWRPWGPWPRVKGKVEKKPEGN